MLEQVGYRMCLVEIATNPQGYHVHADEVLNRYTPDQDLATPTRYHMSGHHCNLDIMPLYRSVIWNS
jgi:hypothetical protein